jgi:hypothetical protein
MYVVKISKYNLKYCEKAIIVTYCALLWGILFLFSSEFYKPAKGLAMVFPILVSVTKIFV